MGIHQMLMGGGSDFISYPVDEVFGLKDYTGNDTGSNTTNVITNGIDLAGEGGLMIFKSYDAPGSPGINRFVWVDTEDKHLSWLYGGDGDGYRMMGTSKGTDYFGNYTYYSAYSVTSLNSDGFTLGQSMFGENNNNYPYISYTFRKAENFFDIVTYTGNGGGASNNSQSIPHSLGRTPGMVIYKATGPLNSSRSNWGVWHKSGHVSGIGDEADPPSCYFNFEDDSDSALSNTHFIEATSGGAPFDNTPPDADNLYLKWDNGEDDAQQWNEDGEEYVAYIFDTDTNIIKCGSYQGTGSTGLAVTGLGFQPGFLMIKSVNELTDWFIWDSVRDTTGDNTKPLKLNSEDNELDSTNYAVSFDSDGFTLNTSHPGLNNSSSNHYIYMAIADPT